MIYTYTWAANLSDARTRAGLTVAALAEAAGCTEATVTDIEAGDHLPSDALKVRLAQAVEVHVHDLFPLA